MGIIELIELFFIALSLSMDAFAVSACIGLGLSGNENIKDNNIKNNSKNKAAAIAGLYFGFFQAAMPLIGYAAGIKFAEKISHFSHWISFMLLLFIGGKMIKDSFAKSDKSKEQMDTENALKIRKMLPLAVATSIDALAVGVSFAFLRVNIIFSVSIIGAVTFILSAIGVKIGGIFGTKFKSKSELAGGIVLILIGVKILVERLIM